MRVQRVLANARGHGLRLYSQARHASGEIHMGVQTAARFYGALLQPALRAAGVDTYDADRKLMGAYSGYRELKDRLDQGFRIGDGVIAHLAGSHEYPT